MLASLNHPNIGAIHGLEESDGVRALVMELVEGRTLADGSRAGPIPVDEALPIARQIAEALEAAHEQGIVHRDLKPANIKVRDDGTVKVLDFGLAKLRSAAPSASMHRRAMRCRSRRRSPVRRMTRRGVILGTAAYMAPEQAKGKPADKRSDIWAFGCVLYEMLTGTRAFDGDDVTDTLASVLKTRARLDAAARVGTSAGPTRRSSAACRRIARTGWQTRRLSCLRSAIRRLPLGQPLKRRPRLVVVVNGSRFSP